MIAPVLSSPIPKSIATASLLAQIICNKYQFGLPLYRQEMLFQQSGIDIDRRSMANWMIKCAAWFERITDGLKIHLLQQIALHADETPVKVIDEDRERSYMWVYCSGAGSPVRTTRLNLKTSVKPYCGRQTLESTAFLTKIRLTVAVLLLSSRFLPKTPYIPRL